MSINTFYFHTKEDAIEFSKRFNKVEHSVSIQQVANGYQLIVQYWSLD